MKIIIDERETALYDKCYSYILSLPLPTYAQLYKEVLPIGDILIRTDEDKDVLLIERKSFSDLLASIKDGRYEEQSYRLVNSSGFPPHSVIYLLEGMFSQLRTPMEKKIIYSSMTSLQFFKGFSIQRTSTVSETAEWLVLMADKIEREFLKGKIPYYLTDPFLRYFKRAPAIVTVPSTTLENTLTPTAVVSVDCDTLVVAEQKQEPDTNLTAANYCSVVKKVKKDNVTPENIGEIILCQIPGISSVTAIAIMKKFTNFPTLMDELNKNPNCLDNFTCENSGKSRKISKSCIESIRRYLLHNHTLALPILGL